MKLIIGLGNPEQKYSGTRHNIGFVVLDNFADKKGSSFSVKDKFKAVIAETEIEGEKALLVKPLTYYNLVGESAQAIANFYKIDPSDILIVHDDLALPFGIIRTRIGGSDAGNNGIKSLNAHLGSDTARLRVGIYNDLRDQIDDAAFVLAKFTKAESEKLAEISQKAVAIIDDFIADNFDTTTHR